MRITLRGVCTAVLGIVLVLTPLGCAEATDAINAANGAVSAVNGGVSAVNGGVSAANDAASRAKEAYNGVQSAVNGATSAAQPSAASDPSKPCGDYTEPQTSQPVEEIACNKNVGTPVFSDAASTPPPSNVEVRIVAGTHMHIKCRTPDAGNIQSVAEFYLILDGPWAGLYAPADTFWNNNRSVNERIPQC